MEIWRIVDELKQIYEIHSCYRLPSITTDNFQYISDFEDIPPLNGKQYQEYLEKQLKNFYHPHSLEIIECRSCKYLIEIVLQKDMHSLDHYVYKEKPNFYPFQEPRLLQCEVENGKICKMHLCTPDNQRIPDDIQNTLLEAVKKNDFNAAQQAIANGAYAGNCEDGSHSCLEYAAESGSVKLCKLLIDDEAEYKYGLGWEAVFYAVKNPDIEVLKYFLTLDIIVDSVSDFVVEDQPMTILDYAEYLNNQAAVEILRKFNVPTLRELKDWCFTSAKLKIRISEKRMDGGDMSIGGVCEEVNEYAGLHCGNSEMCLWMDLNDCCQYIIPFFLEFFTKPFEAYLEDNLVTLENAGRTLTEIRNFCDLLNNDFDNPEVQRILDKTCPTSHIEWNGHSSLISFHFSVAEEKQLWTAKKQSLIDFYEEFCQKFETMLIKAKEAGDCYISFVGP
jgi:hypothetical protein